MRAPLLVLLAGLWLAPVAAALPSLSLAAVELDADPRTPGVQLDGSIQTGDPFRIDVLAADFGDPLAAFAFDLFFTPELADPTGLAAGTFLSPLVLAEQDLLAPDVNVTGAGAGSIGGGVLVSIGFEALGPGTLELAFGDVLLSAPGGIPLAEVSLLGLSLPIAPLPEPGAGLWLALAAAGLRRRRRVPRRYTRAPWNTAISDAAA